MEESFDFIYIEWAHETQTLQLIRVFLVCTMWSFFLLLQPKRCPAFNSLFRMFLSCFNNTRHRRANTPQANSNKKRAKSRWSERAVVDTRTRDTAMLWRPKTGFVVDYKIYLFFLFSFSESTRAREANNEKEEKSECCADAALFLWQKTRLQRTVWELFCAQSFWLIQRSRELKIEDIQYREAKRNFIESWDLCRCLRKRERKTNFRFLRPLEKIVSLTSSNDHSHAAW